MTDTTLPQLNGDLWLTDGGLETTLLFLQGVDLSLFAAFPLLDSETGRAALAAYYAPYLAAAAASGRGFVLDTPTWRASREWGEQLGYGVDELTAVNRRAVDFVRGLSTTHPIPTVINGVVGPRGDGYVISEAMSGPEGARFHALQARAFADARADIMTAVTMNYVGEAIGVTLAGREVGLPVAVSFTVETDGRLPSGQSLAEAIAEVDATTDGYPAYFMLNCAHPSHFESVLAQNDPTLARIRGIRANASRASHAELDEATELDRGNPVELAADYRRLAGLLDGLAVVGGCCGTDHEHIRRIADDFGVNAA